VQLKYDCCNENATDDQSNRLQLPLPDQELQKGVVTFDS